MYKKAKGHLRFMSCKSIPKNLRSKVGVFTLIVGMLYVPMVGFAQRINLVRQNVALQDVFKEIRKQSGYNVLSTTGTVNNQRVKSIQLKNASIEESMTKILSGLGLTYKIVEKNIVVSKSHTTQAEKQQPKPILIVGKVVNDKGEAMPSVSVKVKNESTGTSTDKDGNYKINVVDKDVVLVFTYLGYIGQERKVGNNTVVNIKLEKEVSKLNEVVVIAYGEGTKRDLTGSVSQVNMQELEKAPVSNFEEALAGRVAGVYVGATDGQPGSDMNIVIRGGNSLTQENSPLYVIDGFPSEESVGNMISPNDIESITVLKDASATALYGARGANGVVIIETKKPKESAPLINYSLSSGINSVTKNIDVMDPYEFVKLQVELFPTVYEEYYLTRPDVDLDYYKDLPEIKWQDRLFIHSRRNIHDFSIGGGTGTTKYRFSSNVTDNEGVLRNTGYERVLGRLFLDQKILDKGRLVFNISGGKQKTYGEQVRTPSTNDGNSFSTNVMYQLWGYRNVNVGDIDIETELIDPENQDMRVNPYLNLMNVHNMDYTNNVSANAKFIYPFLKKFELNTSALYQYRNVLYERFNNSQTAGGFPSAGNMRGVNGSVSNTNWNSFLNENLLKYKDRLRGGHLIEGLLGFTVQTNETKRNGYSSQQIPNETLGISGIDEGDITNMTSSITDNGLVSFLARANYNYKSKYLLTVSGRWDGSSKFFKNKWGFFPSGAFAWNMKQEDFLKNSSLISNSKIRASYGLTGNNRVPDYAFAPRLAMNYTYYYSFGDDTPDRGIIAPGMGNENLKWETTKQLDLGYDIGFWNDRLSFTVDWYQKKTTDLLMDATMPISSGYGTVFKNIGSIENTGLELTLSTVNVSNKNFTWSTDFNISFNKNKVTALADNQTYLESLVAFPRMRSDWTPLYKTEIGRPASAFYGYVWDGVYQYEDFDLIADKYVLRDDVPTNGNSRSSIQPGDIRYVDLNEDGTITLEDRQYIGRTLPNHYGGLNNSFRYKDFSLSFFLQWSYGNDVFNANRMMFEGNHYNYMNLNQYATYADRWSPDNQESVNFRAGGFGPRGMLSSRTLEDGSFIRLKTVSASYLLPKDWTHRLRLKTLSVGATAQNLFTFTNYSGMDPEVSVRNSILTPGFDFSAYPRERAIVFNFKIGF